MDTRIVIRRSAAFAIVMDVHGLFALDLVTSHKKCTRIMNMVLSVLENAPVDLGRVSNLSFLTNVDGGDTFNTDLSNARHPTDEHRHIVVKKLPDALDQSPHMAS